MGRQWLGGGVRLIGTVLIIGILEYSDWGLLRFNLQVFSYQNLDLGPDASFPTSSCCFDCSRSGIMVQIMA